MSLKAAVIADDLTGSLDTGTPFVEAGLSVAVAVDAGAIEEAVATGAEVVVVNTASRALSADEAAEVVLAAGQKLAAAAPAVVMKKIDSRLKGNVAVESAALAGVFGRESILIAPAIPDQQRFTSGGSVVGRGVDTPLPIAALFAGRSERLAIGDAESDADLDRIVAENDWTSVLAVGARGLGAALARHLGRGHIGSRLQGFEARAETLFAFGSRDPITARQMERLESSGTLATVIDAPMGEVEPVGNIRLPALLRCTGEISHEAAQVAARFAQGVKSVIVATGPEMLMVGGGDTALAVFRELGVRVVRPKGEIEAGIPWFDLTDGAGRQFRCAIKSGGFGNSDSLLRLVPRNQAA